MNSWATTFWGGMIGVIILTIVRGYEDGMRGYSLLLIVGAMAFIFFLIWLLAVIFTVWKDKRAERRKAIGLEK